MRTRLPYLCLTVVLGCAATADNANLVTSVKTFNESMRWKRFQAAASFIPVTGRSSFLSRYRDTEEDLSIESIEIRNMELQETGGVQQAMVTVVSRSYLLPSTVLTTTRMTQHWELKNGAWLLTKTINELVPLQPATDQARPPAPKT